MEVISRVVCAPFKNRNDMEHKHHANGIPDLVDFLLPVPTAKEVAGIFLGAIDAAKERQMKQVVAILDELRGKDGCVAVDVLKRVLTEKIR